MKSRMFIVYCSPAGSTRHVARVVEQTLLPESADLSTLDLGSGDSRSAMIDRIGSAGNSGCLFVGSPVYRDMAVPPIMSFIDALPKVRGGWAVPFVTWGGANSGVALWQMGRALAAKGFALAGAAKVLGVHSLMWQSDHPVGAGHPDAGDDRVVAGLVRSVCKRLADGKVHPLHPDQLDYQPDEQGVEMKQRCARPWMIIPKSIDREQCTQCGVCADLCPVQSITLSPFPEFDQNCFDCFNCIRLCPEDAIRPARSLQDIEKMILKRVETFNEQPGTEVYFDGTISQ